MKLGRRVKILWNEMDSCMVVLHRIDPQPCLLRDERVHIFDWFGRSLREVRWELGSCPPACCSLCSQYGAWNCPPSRMTQRQPHLRSSALPITSLVRIQSSKVFLTYHFVMICKVLQKARSRGSPLQNALAPPKALCFFLFLYIYLCHIQVVLETNKCINIMSSHFVVGTRFVYLLHFTIVSEMFQVVCAGACHAWARRLHDRCGVKIWENYARLRPLWCKPKGGTDMGISRLQGNLLWHQTFSCSWRNIAFRILQLTGSCPPTDRYSIGSCSAAMQLDVFSVSVST